MGQNAASPIDDFEQITGQANLSMNNLWQWGGGDFSPTDSWSPAINIYKLKTRIEICVELAGVDPRKIKIQVKTGCLTIRGVRQAPDPAGYDPKDQEMRILTMEVDHGVFCRQVGLSEQVDATKVETRYEKGFLWITLPLRVPG